MQRNSITEAIVLKTYNVGEADRYCIILSKDLGRIHVRANGARKTGSKLGPYLLSGQCIEVQIHNSATSSIVQSAQLLSSAMQSANTHVLQTIFECCLLLLPEHEPVDTVYSVVHRCITAKQVSTAAALVQILHSLGYIPSIYEAEIIQACTKEEHTVLQNIIEHGELHIDASYAIFEQRLLRWALKKIEQESGKPLNSIISV